MSYQKTTIKKVIEDIDQNKIYLPALQRKFVWNKRQIELLFDSLMRNYPFGTFLFWRLHRKKAENYVFYEFLKEYDERNPYNRRKTGAFLHEEIVGVLDGQQRLSSMYIGLMGTHAEKARYKRVSNPNAYEKMCLYLNLLSLPYEIDEEDNIKINEEQNFEFRFLTEEGARSSVTRKVTGENGTFSEEIPMFWMKVGKVLSWRNEPEFDRIVDDFQKQCRTEAQKEAILQNKRFIKRALDTLHRRMHRDELINYFEVARDDLEDILKIFVRVNSGGTVLSKTDLLFSTIVATWDNGREQIEKLLKKINEKGDGFSFGNEYLMRCCLVLSDGPVVYKVNSFKSENVEKIRNEWPQIAAAIEKTVDLLAEFGFNGSVLSSQNATIIIAYFLYKGGSINKESKEGIQKYLIHALLNGIYGSQQDQLITELRKAFREEVKNDTNGIAYRGRYRDFSFEDVLEIKLPQQKSLAVTEDDIERFLHYKKGLGAFLVLSLLYPQLRYNEVIFHQDHIHPATGFNEEKYREMKIPQDQWQDWYDLRDCVPNLQLMSGRQNSTKNATPFKEWFMQMDESDRTAFSKNNYLPDDVDLDFENFIVFFKQRKEKLRLELRKVLKVQALTAGQLAVLTDWDGHNDEIDEQEYATSGGFSE
ncbi:hypothetical protein MSSIT_0940 [Methanosarcina siciliae T4/M]|uniref:GmrSD restriction endonucleases N-terminal domain-containing protein n=1 Tax=Methanosarcina siciliae T4/M TaxID=1434120 RepID=A0A0E3P4Y9_9EURY|nr:DUF262 domain-containing protein [Methanosarcina siciliae]AKB27659.1 hypothetical protein MSSIT_0940 [Methanosarcina siciliae T4/M]